MRKFLSAICASALTAAVAVTGVVPATAAPVYVPVAQPAQTTSGIQGGEVVQVQERLLRRQFRRDRREFRRDRRDFRQARRDFRNDRRYGWYNGHRGYRYKRSGYRYYNGWWYPAGAFVAGAIIGGAIANSNNYNEPRYYRGAGGSAHVQWCYDQYRSYRASDNTFQPYNGPRRQCYSPYG